MTALLAAVALAIVPLFTAPAAHAADDPTPTPTPTAAPGGIVESFLSTDANGVLEADRDLTAHVTLRNGGDTAVAETDVTLSLGMKALASRDELTSWLGAGTAGGDTDTEPDVDPDTADPDPSTASTGALTTLGTGSIAAVEPGDAASVDITVAADDKALTKLKPGVYPLSATITGPSQTRVATSVLTVPKKHDTGRTPVAVVVPITAGPLRDGLLTSDQLEALTAPDGELTAELNAVAGTSAILAIDPAIPASIRVLGTSAPDTARTWLERLDLLSNERFALQFGDADIAAQLHDGRSSLLQPTTLTPYMDAADFDDTTDDDTDTADSDEQSPTPTNTPTPGAPAFPTMDELQSLGDHTRDAVYWPFSGSVGADAVAALAAGSNDDTDAVTLLSSDSASTGGAHARLDGADVLVYDATVSNALRTASIEDEPDIRDAALSEVTAYLNMASRTGDGSPLMVVVDRASTRSLLGLSAAVEAVTGAPGTTSATLTRLLDASPRTLTVTDAAADTARVDTLRSLLDGERRVASFATVLEDPTLLTGPERASMLQLMGGGWLDDPDSWADALAGHRQQTTDTLESVSIAPTSDFNLAGRVATRSFGIRNDLPWPVHVTLLAHPSNLRLEVQESTEVVAQAASTTAAHVPIQAKIGNGDVTLNLRLVSPTGEPIGQPRAVVITVHADWEVIGLVILGVGIGAFLVLGLVRTVLSRRRRATDAAADANSGGPNSGGLSSGDASSGDTGSAGPHGDAS